MKSYSSKKAVALIILIVTIIVLAIITGIVVYYIDKDNMINESKDTISNYSSRLITEEIEVYEADFVDKTRQKLTSTIKQQLAEIMKEEKIGLGKLTVLYDKNTNTQHICYRYDKVTAEEIDILEAQGVEMLRGDADLDGFLTDKDANIIIQYYDYILVLNETQLYVADINEDGATDATDARIITDILAGVTSYTGGTL